MIGCLLGCNSYQAIKAEPTFYAIVGSLAVGCGITLLVLGILGMHNVLHTAVSDNKMLLGFGGAMIGLVASEVIALIIANRIKGS